MKHLFSILLAALILWTCSDDNVIQPTSEFSFDKSHGIIITDTLYTVDEKSIIKDPIETSASSVLSMGRTSEFEVYFLIKFSDIPDDSVTLDSVVLELRGLGKLAFSEQSELQIEIHALNEEWDGSVNTIEKWRNFTPGTPYKSMMISLEDSVSYPISIGNDLVAQWQIEDQNHGLLFRASDMENQAIKEFGSFNSEANKPSLRYKYGTNDTTVYDTLTAGVDATVFKYTGTIFEEEKQNNRLLISSGFTSRTYFKFDYSSIPPNAVISKANLILPMDTDNKYDNPNQADNYYLRSIVEVVDDLTVDSTLSYNVNVNYILKEEGNEIVLFPDDAVSFGQGYIQALINKDISHEWYSVQYVNESKSLSLTKVFGSDPSSFRGPKLVLRYLFVE